MSCDLSSLKQEPGVSCRSRLEKKGFKLLCCEKTNSSELRSFFPRSFVTFQYPPIPREGGRFTLDLEVWVTMETGEQENPEMGVVRQTEME